MYGLVLYKYRKIILNKKQKKGVKKMEETRLVRLSKLLESKDPIGEITVEAMMENLKESMTSGGKKYVSGELTDHNYRLEFKIWNTSMDGFLERYKLEKDRAYVVQATGSYEFFNNIPQFSIRGSIAVVEDEKRVAEYLDTAPIDISGTIDGLQKVAEMIVKDPVLHSIYYDALDIDNNNYMICPYSDTIHTEKSGYIFHLNNCLARATVTKGCPSVYVKRTGKDGKISMVKVPATDIQIVCTAIMCYHSATSLDGVKIDPITGRVLKKNEVRNVLLGSVSNVLKTKELIAKAFKETKAESCDKTVNLLHCVAAMNKIVSPATLEAKMACDIIDSEIEEWEYFKKISALGIDETCVFKREEEKNTLIRLSTNGSVIKEKTES